MIQDAPSQQITITPDTKSDLYEALRDSSTNYKVTLAPGEFTFRETLLLPSNIEIRGAGAKETVLILEKNSNCHLFTNVDHSRGNENIEVEDISIIGNSSHQERQPHHKALTFCCGIYLKKCTNVKVLNCTFDDIRQTAIHFNESSKITVKNCYMNKMGWSGVSSSDASDFQIKNVTIKNAGLDKMHSSVHLDGGIGVYCEATTIGATGNGIMLDSNYAQLRQVVVDGHAKNCKRGVSLSGSAKNVLSQVFITGDFSENRDVGVMVSNSDNVTIYNSRITKNDKIGLLLQGRNGGNYVSIIDCVIDENGEQNVSQIHESKGNWIFVTEPEIISADTNKVSINETAHRNHKATK